MADSFTNNNSSDQKSFTLYTGKAPVIIQIIGGLLWLGAAGTIIMGLLNLIINPIQGIIFLVTAVFFILTARSMFKMKKTAFRNSIILAVLLALLAVYVLMTSINTPSYSNFIYPILLFFVAFYYRNRFVN